MGNRKAKATLFGASIFAAFTIWAVHYQQHQERATMYKGVLRDDERRRAKSKQREDDLRESQRKRQIYERVQTVDRSSAS
ncbi:hypothetical protein BYT27DRAFT_7152876 [Phlegmacium glaucopus]|nr:hypothetical protein BYT27DRAFT_7152876 [Phlegmacium glaucopus]